MKANATSELHQQTLPTASAHLCQHHALHIAWRERHRNSSSPTVTVPRGLQLEKRREWRPEERIGPEPYEPPIAEAQYAFLYFSVIQIKVVRAYRGSCSDAAGQEGRANSSAMPVIRLIWRGKPTRAATLRLRACALSLLSAHLSDTQQSIKLLQQLLMRLVEA